MLIMFKQSLLNLFLNISTTLIIVTVLIFPVKTTKLSHHIEKTSKTQKDENQCGHAFGIVSGKIVGGYDVGYYKYPWFVALYKDGMPYCGATLVTKKSVVTAAHCYQQYLHNPKGIENEYDLKMGTYNICNTHEPDLKTYKARKVYIHEKYENEDPFFDIALIVLKENVGFEPVCLPSKPYQSKERPKEGIIAGYGVLKFQDYKTSCIMREARVRIYSDKECKKMLHKADPEVDNFANAFCAGYLKGGVDACQGDSGGPLMVLGSGSRFVLLGITSFGYKCADKNLLGIYTDASKYLDWINQKTNAPITDNPSDTDTDDGDDEESDENGENDEGDDNDDNDEGDDSDEDGEKKKRKLRKEKEPNLHSSSHYRHKKNHSYKNEYHGNGTKKKNTSMRTKTVFEIKKMNKKKLNKNEF